MPCQIRLSQFELLLKIGCSEQERATEQPLNFQVTVSRDQIFEASESDEVSDTLDAAVIRQVLVEAATSAGVKTLERLGQLMELRLRKQFLLTGCQWHLVIEKPQFGWSYVHTWST
jgi:FolB domain-containing protein